MLDPNEPHWFESTFTQLPDVGRKQLGAILGGLIADAAVNGIDIDSMQNPHDAEHVELFQRVSLPPATAAVTKKSIGRSDTNNDIVNDAAQLLAHRKLFTTWSPAAVASIGILDAIDSSKSVDSRVWERACAAALQRTIEAMPPEISSQLPAANFSLFPVCVATPIVALYPWARDEDVHSNVSSIISAIAQLDDEARGSVSAAEGKSTRRRHFALCPPLTSPTAVESGDDSTAAAMADAASKTVEHYLCASSVLLRYLQSNPDPARNAILKLSSEQCGFTQLPLAELATTVKNDLSWNSSNDVLLSAWRILRADFHLSQPSPVNFEKVVRRCLAEAIRRRNNYCSGALSVSGIATHLTCYVGACVGAKYGVRQLPSEWMSACDERTDGTLTRTVSSAVSLSQWVWNPPS